MNITPNIKQMYRIRNQRTRLLWSNDWGWGGEGYDVYNAAGYIFFKDSLPMDGVWEQDAPLTETDIELFERL